MRTISVDAPAKVNLNLLVGAVIPAGNPKAGYHPVVSLMACVGLADEVRVTERGDGEESGLVVRWAGDAPRVSAIDWPVEKDLSVRALRRLERYAGRDLPVEIEIVKRIPVGGGLGGGSSDAAAALVGIDRLVGLGLSTAELMGHAAELGSDVGFFVRCAREGVSRAVVSGLGDRVEARPTPANAGSAVLILPPFGCDTAKVYREFDRVDAGSDRGWMAPEAEPRVNMLTGAATRVEPRLGVLIAAVSACAGAGKVWMTGSGSTVCVGCASGMTNATLLEVRAALAREACRCLELAWMAEVVCVGVALG